MTSIFVSIASYRDPDLAATVANLVETVSGDSSLRIVILSQTLPEERDDLPAEQLGGRVRIEQHFIDPRDSQGVCWARAQIQQHYAGEDFMLQLDSHMRMEPDWDHALLSDYAICSKRGPAVLTAYLPEFNWVGGVETVTDRRVSHFQLVLTDWLPTARAAWGHPHPAPVRADFFSGHMAFAPGKFLADVPYDPELFFMGEEISMALRAHSAGYDLYTPTRFIGAHNYKRDDAANRPRPLFWDRDEDRGREISAAQRDRASKLKVAAICRGELHGRFGIVDQARYGVMKERIQRLHGIDLGSVYAPGEQSSHA